MARQHSITLKCVKMNCVRLQHPGKKLPLFVAPQCYISCYKMIQWSFFWWKKWHSENVAPTSAIPCLCTICDLTLRPDLLRGCRFSWTGRLFWAYMGWQWCHKCFLILWARVKFSPRDSPEFSCCSGRGGRGVEPTDVERRAGGVVVVGVSVASLPFNTMVFLQMTDAA